MTQERGIVCMFCGEGFGYDGEKPDDETMKAAVDHEKACPENPYLAEIADLKEQFRIATIYISEYIAWIGKTEAALAVESKALLLACEHVLPASVKMVDSKFSIEIINNDKNLLSDYFRDKAKE